MKLFKVLLLAGAVVSIAGMACLQLFVLVANKLFSKPVIQHQP
jgi:hypothetical protein